ncbi:transcriptional regulator, TetR family [Thalassovita taeanensis]|uniref:Transcriptional regulator, TetR family n=2 Tax=Thalassovita taeanensis TaxID=657014 RepID=A0A1H9ECM5_9RHOB|nr:transcriptional regulator, TetR family [Thalassovita taeanensis]
MRKRGSKGEHTKLALRQNAISLLYKHGYEGMSLRLLARETGLQAGSIYNYIDSKEEFVAQIVCDTLRELVDAILESFEDNDQVKEKLRKYVSTLVDWNTLRKHEAVISQSETRMLPKSFLNEFMKLRREFEMIGLRLIEEGVEEGVFRVSDPILASIAMYNLLMGIAVWYKDDGRLGADELKIEYYTLIENMLGVRSSLNG